MTFRRGLYSLSCFVQLVRIAEQEETDHKQYSNGTNCQAGIHHRDTEDGEGHTLSSLADHSHQGSTHKGCALAADIHQTVVLTALFCGDDLTQVRTAQGLDAALEHTHQHSRSPELPQGCQEDGKESNAGVAQDADLDQQAGIVLGSQSAKEDSKGESHDLGHQQGQPILFNMYLNILFLK